MSALWIYLAFSVGTMIGFGLFAALQISREQDERQPARSEDYRFASGCFRRAAGRLRGPVRTQWPRGLDEALIWDKPAPLRRRQTTRVVA